MERARVSVWELSGIFLRIGNFTFGGGDPTMAALHRELVRLRGWLSPVQYGLTFGLARATPGTNVLAFCAGAGWAIRGWIGAIAAVLAATGPSAIVIVWLTAGYQVLHANPLAARVIGAILAAAVGMMLAAAWQLMRPGLKGRRAVRTIVLFAAACAVLVFRLLHPLAVLGLAAIAGLLWQEPE